MSNSPPPPPPFPGNESVILTNTDSRLASIEQRLHIVEQYLEQQDQLQNNSFASFASLHASNLAVPSTVLNETNVANNSFQSTASSGGKNKTKSNKKKKRKNQTKRKRKV